MGVPQNARNSSVLYAMLLVTLLIVAGVTIYFSWSVTTEKALRTDKNIITLNGPWKFIAGDNMQYALADYDDSGWENTDFAAPPGAHDDDVGLSGFIPGWTAKGHPDYSGYAWYRLKVSLDSIPGNDLALAAPPAVDDVYQLFMNGSLSGSAGNFSGTVPIVHSIRPGMFLLPENVKKEKNVTIAFRVWMNPFSLGPDAGGIHIAPALGEKTHIEKKYRFQWTQTIKGYIVEVALPVMFVLLAITIFLQNRNIKPSRSCKWIITALILTGLMRLNQAVYYWFQIENNYQADIIGPVILKSLVLGSWLMAWREWFDMHKPKWLPTMIAILTLLYMMAQLFGLSWISKAAIHNHFLTVADYIRLLMLTTMLFIFYQGIRKQGTKDLLALLAGLLMTIALFPKEVSVLHVIPGIWFPYGVGVSRGQFFYAAFVFVMYVVLMLKNKKEKPAYGIAPTGDKRL